MRNRISKIISKDAQKDPLNVNTAKHLLHFKKSSNICRYAKIKLENAKYAPTL